MKIDALDWLVGESNSLLFEYELDGQMVHGLQNDFVHRSPLLRSDFRGWLELERFLVRSQADRPCFRTVLINNFVSKMDD